MTRPKARLKGDGAWTKPRDFSPQLKQILSELCPPGFKAEEFTNHILAEARPGIDAQQHQKHDLVKGDMRAEISKVLTALRRTIRTITDVEKMLRKLSRSVDIPLGVDADPLGCADHLKDIIPYFENARSETEKAPERKKKTTKEC